MRHELHLISGLVLLLIWSAATWDLRQRRIPNVLVMAGAATGILLQWMLAGSGGFLATISGLAVGLGILLPGYLLGMTGAGDVKLMAAVGTFLGPYHVLLAALASIFVGGVIALGFAASALFSRNSISPWARYGLMVKTLVTTGRPIYAAPAEGEVMGRKFPFAVSIALGTTGFLAWQLWQGTL
ncbi:pilus assembly-related outer membrane protein [Litchfieldella qijiaojingensis]|uniref:Pilus assembly-related outer membrane protein n=1 Tax=Litchfieldella qijiaojingensis TaxID=980347 RepID=A0ABQ2YIF6_9GAMM|nr:A24 family peptidase [Halomonas qijiaojingensis]GGX82979.1 pilus assembly-related outer membrane protein [Halomonas qijiaojingensis]